MPIPKLDHDGFLPSGIHLASLAEVISQFGVGSEIREQQARLLTAGEALFLVRQNLAT